MISVPAAVMEREKEARSALLEALADHDDALLEKMLEDVAPTPDEIYGQLHKDVAEGTIVPVLLGRGGAGARGAAAVEGAAARYAGPAADRRAARRRRRRASRCCRSSRRCTPGMRASCRMRGFGAAR